MNRFTTVAFRIAAATTLMGSLLGAQKPMANTAPPGDTSIFAPLILAPATSATRSATGAPGPKYWQNRADYDLKATLDTVEKTLRSSMVLRYTNNSPNTLDMIWVQVERSTAVIDRFDQMVGARATSLVYRRPPDDEYELQVTLAEPLKPGKTATFHVDWHLRARGEQEGRLFQVAQWYPRVNVYDDVKGWNTESIKLGGEYFLEYGDYTLELTLPANFIVAATGTLDNPKEVLPAAQIARLAVAVKADTVVRVITAEELKSGAARPKTDKMLTWKFHAKNVRDEVWCASPDYQWDVTSWKGIIAQAYYRPSATATWIDAADQARMSIQEYSERWFPYPYPQISAVEGTDAGMEYPMLSMVSRYDSQPQLYYVITHEIGHNWFPMIVGSNERMHTWMDEGFNTFINSFSEARRYPANGDQNTRIGKWVADTNGAVLENGTVIGNDLPQYVKTGKVLQVLRRDIMGPEVFDKAFRTYIQQWAYKHPTPMDFFRTMAYAHGRNLDWFWRGAFLEVPRFDQGIDSVHQSAQGSDTKVTVTYGNYGRMVMPLIVRFTFSDGTTQDVNYPADVWRTNSRAYSMAYTFKKTVSQIALDPESHLPDVKRSNNGWVAK